ncbi:MAG: flagellar basal body rod protein FlgC [Parvularculaceae bacterium]
MNIFAKTSAAATSGLRAQAYRLQVVAQNLANADTHGYRRKIVSFDQSFDRAAGAQTVRIKSISLDPKKPERLFDPSHPLADDEGYVERSNVNILTELADAREANQSYQAGLQIFSQARQMYSNLLEILKR